MRGCTVVKYTYLKKIFIKNITSKRGTNNNKEAKNKNMSMVQTPIISVFVTFFAGQIYAATNGQTI